MQCACNGTSAVREKNYSDNINAVADLEMFRGCFRLRKFLNCQGCPLWNCNFSLAQFKLKTTKKKSLPAVERCNAHFQRQKYEVWPNRK